MQMLTLELTRIAYAARRMKASLSHLTLKPTQHSHDAPQAEHNPDRPMRLTLLTTSLRINRIEPVFKFECV